jgi:Domain of unknown function (DUF1707)
VAYGSAQAFPPQPGVPAGAGSGVPWMNPAWLAASADRERAVGVLRAGFAEGRLSQDELHDRVARAYAARTYGELWALTADLPAGPFVPVSGPVAVPAGKAAQASSWRPAAALIITALVIFTLAALITAIVTRQAGPVGFQRVNEVTVLPYQQAVPVPGSGQQAVLTPFITRMQGQWNGNRERGGLVWSPPGP